MALARVSMLSLTVLSSNFQRCASSLRSLSTTRNYIDVSASLSDQNQSPTHSIVSFETKKDRWKPMCLYYTQGKCTKMDDLMHLETFNHDFSKELRVDGVEVDPMRPQHLDYLLVLDLEGKVEILEFPLVMIDAKTMKYVDFFHRFVKPVKMTKERVDEYVAGKYGKFGVDRVWHDTAIPFNEVLLQFESWMVDHNLLDGQMGRALVQAAFVTCGNWDLKTKVPQQCRDLGMKLPSYFMEWINLIDIYLNFYNRRATGMRTMMKELGIPLVGSHHLGIDDSKNIARVLQRMLADGAVMQITARRSEHSPENVKFLFKNWIK